MESARGSFCTTGPVMSPRGIPQWLLNPTVYEPNGRGSCERSVQLSSLKEQEAGCLSSLSKIYQLGKKGHAAPLVGAGLDESNPMKWMDSQGHKDQLQLRPLLPLLKMYVNGVTSNKIDGSLSLHVLSDSDHTLVTHLRV